LDRARGFVIYEVREAEITLLEYRCGSFTGYRPGSQEQRHDSGHDNAVLKALADCDLVISRGMSHRLEAELQAAHIRHFTTGESDVVAALNHLRQAEFD
jgi:hypothetical protein